LRRRVDVTTIDDDDDDDTQEDDEARADDEHEGPIEIDFGDTVIRRRDGTVAPDDVSDSSNSS
jgi:hypothetical protein